ncbi:apoptosis facilitator Bcl-2-like protein 14 [Centropristis striata]|uniref:apoptosis facilitator Bcl-2-like protein 14 n=1 Tax=Centropristis striata TaxID=184440 RepID=UPI0027E1A8CB|nr:apoptosis facilitator Bcl-2-like protein 14 [Centropristis striata]
MANGHVEIHDPFSNHNGVKKSKNCDPKSTSDSDSMEDTEEYRLLMAYAQRRRPKKESPTQDSTVLVSGGSDANGSASPQTPEKKKKKKPWKRIFSCIKPKTIDEDEVLSPFRSKHSEVNDRCGGTNEVLPCPKGADEFEEAAGRLTKIADEIPFTPPEVETDSPEDENVEKMIGLLLRETGDRANDEELENAALAKELFWDYSFFKRLMSTLLTRMGLRTPDPESPGPKACPETQIAVTCEVTSRLSAVNRLPTNLLLNHGARYLQDYYSSWVKEQGGYEKAFYSDDEDD